MKDIISSEKLRFGDVCFLNDTTEFEEAVRILKIAVERKKASKEKTLYDILTDKDFLDEIKSYYQRYSFYPLINNNRDIDGIKPICKVYTCSFSMDGDLRPMWIDYAQKDNGISIIFTELEDHMKATENVKIICGKVWYIIPMEILIL